MHTLNKLSACILTGTLILANKKHGSAAMLKGGCYL